MPTRHHARAILLIAVALAMLVSLAPAQRFAASPHFAPSHFAPGFGPAGRGRSFYYPLAYGDPFYGDYLSTGYPVASQPPMIVFQAPPAPSPSERPAAPLQPLLIELRGDRYVRLSGPENLGAETIDHIPDSSSQPDRATPRSTAPKSAAPQSTTIAEVEPAVLVFRDGHREELYDYTIADGILYTRANLYTDGSWTRKIPLASLNLPETIQSNQSRAVAFRLPSSPNEVIVRP